MRINYLSRQDIKIILHYLGYIMIGIGVILLVPILIDLCYLENRYFIGLIPPAISIGLGFLFVEMFKQYDKLKFKHSMFISSVAWLWAGFVGAIIMMLILDISFIDAFFENISAWTGSGLTMFSDVESLPMSILFLRSLDEARDDRIRPNIKNTLKKTIEIYLIYTLFGIILYILAGLPLFDSVNLTFTTISTGGMSIKNANVGFYNNNIVYLITMVLMLLGATSFTVHYNLVKTKGKSIIKDIQFQAIILSIIISGILIAAITHMAPMNVIFHIVSAVTTTGANIASSSELASWAPASLIIIMLLMVMGGSSGSTVGAVKTIRVITFLRGINLTVTNVIAPKRVVNTKIANKTFNEREIKEASSYITVYLMFLIVSWIIMTFYTNDPINSLFDVTSTIGNVGLSTGMINGSLATLPKIMLIFLMWIGRLEIIPILLTIQLGFRTFDQSLKLAKRKFRRIINLR